MYAASFGSPLRDLPPLVEVFEHEPIEIALDPEATHDPAAMPAAHGELALVYEIGSTRPRRLERDLLDRLSRTRPPAATTSKQRACGAATDTRCFLSLIVLITRTGGTRSTT
jgi:hypothetical protein